MGVESGKTRKGGLGGRGVWYRGEEGEWGKGEGGEGGRGDGWRGSSSVNSRLFSTVKFQVHIARIRYLQV